MKQHIFSFVVRHDLSIISSDNFAEMSDYLFREFRNKCNDLDQLRNDIEEVLNDLKFDA